MKILLLIILFYLFSLSINAQPLFDLGKFPADTNNEKPLLTSDLLDKLNWESIKKFCDRTEGHYVRTYVDSLKITYKYTKQGYVSYFRIVSYKGMLLKYVSRITNTSKPSNTFYFDKKVWITYVNDELPNLPDSLKLSINEPQKTLVAYYNFLGVDTRDEYGWICEYSTVGEPPGKRYALLELIHYGRIDLIRQLMNYPNTQIQVYVADALIYNDYLTKKRIKENQINLEKEKSRLDSLQKSEFSEEWRIESTIDYIEYLKNRDVELNSELLKDSDWEWIYRLRDSGKIVITCGNMGSYKLYETKVSELLSEEAIALIPQNYENVLSGIIFTKTSH